MSFILRFLVIELHVRLPWSLQGKQSRKTSLLRKRFHDMLLSEGYWLDIKLTRLVQLYGIQGSIFGWHREKWQGMLWWHTKQLKGAKSCERWNYQEQLPSKSRIIISRLREGLVQHNSEAPIEVSIFPIHLINLSVDRSWPWRMAILSNLKLLMPQEKSLIDKSCKKGGDAACPKSTCQLIKQKE